MTYWLLIIIAAGRGGVGKTLLAAMLAAYLLRLGRPPLLIEADVQRRLHALYPALTVPVNINCWEEMQQDPLALARAFARIPEVARVCAAAGRDQLVDTAATWHTPIIEYCAEINLAQLVQDLGGRLVFLLPITADLDSMNLMIGTIRMIEALLPAAKIVPVRNAYQGVPEIWSPALVEKFGQTELKRISKKHPAIAFPAISPIIWGPFERANLSVIDVIAGDPKKLMAITKTDQDTTAIMQCRIADWANRAFEQLEHIFALRND